MSSAELSRMIEDGLLNPGARKAIGALDASFLAQYALTLDEAAILRNKPTPDKLAALGLPPLLAMWGAFMCNPEFRASMSAGEYFSAGHHPAERADG
jgi:hypothetical protein